MFSGIQRYLIRWVSTLVTGLFVVATQIETADAKEKRTAAEGDADEMRRRDKAAVDGARIPIEG